MAFRAIWVFIFLVFGSCNKSKTREINTLINFLGVCTPQNANKLAIAQFKLDVVCNCTLRVQLHFIILHSGKLSIKAELGHHPIPRKEVVQPK